MQPGVVFNQGCKNLSRASRFSAISPMVTTVLLVTASFAITRYSGPLCFALPNFPSMAIRSISIQLPVNMAELTLGVSKLVR